MQIHRRATDAEMVLEIVGDMDIATASRVADQIREVEILAPPWRLLIDLSAVEFMDSSGLRVLVEARNRFLDGGGELALRSGTGQVQRLFARTGLSDEFTFLS
jgi:anti-anti-sigma factor